MKIFDLFFISIFALILTSLFIVATNYNQIFNKTQYEQNQFNKNINIKDKVNSLLDDLLNNTKASRVGIYLYHNGTHSLTNQSFFYKSQNFERVKSGISFEIINNQRIPTSTDIDVNRLNKGECVFSNSIDFNTHQGHSYKMRNTTSYYKCPIFDLKTSNLIGYLSIEFIEKINEDKNIITLLRNYSSSLAGLLK